MVGVIDRAGEAAVDGVVLEHIGHVIRSDQIVDADKLNALVLEAGAENQAADAAKTINANFDHKSLSSSN